MKLENIKQIYNSAVSFNHSCYIVDIIKMATEEIMWKFNEYNKRVFDVDYESGEKLKLTQNKK